MMSRKFRDSQDLVAKWDEDGDVDFYDWAKVLLKEDIPDFIAWLQEGPPKPKWRITREFDFKPTFAQGPPFSRIWTVLTDDDVDEVEG